jgi:hypothetical protein
MSKNQTAPVVVAFILSMSESYIYSNQLKKGSLRAIYTVILGMLQSIWLLTII